MSLAGAGELPGWPEGTVVLLGTVDGGPHVIPVSAAVSAGPRRALIALAQGRGSLARLRDDPRVALCVVCEGVAATAHGRARVVEEALVEGVAAVEVTVEEVQDHNRPTFQIEGGVRWRWTDPAARERDTAVREGLAALAAESAGGPS